MQDESRKPVTATFCRPLRNAVRPESGPRVSPAREWLAKGQTGFARGRTPSRSGKSLPKPSSSLLPAPAGTAFAAKKFRLCGRRLISLRKAILFLPRKNTRRDGDMLHTNSFFTRVLTVRLLLAADRLVIETWKRKECLSFWQEIPCLGDNPTRALLQVPVEFLLNLHSPPLMGERSVGLSVSS